MSKEVNPGTLLELSSGYWSGFALHAAVKLGMVQLLAGEALSAARIASRLDISPRGVETMLPALEGLGILEKRNEAYRVTPPLRDSLSEDSDSSLISIIRHHADLAHMWLGLADSVRSGQPADRPPEIEGRENFYQGMLNLGRASAPGVAASLGLEPGRLLDLGGGPGVYAHAFCAETPGLKATVFDLPQASRHFAAYGKGRPDSSRVDFLAGDYAENDFGGPYDYIWLSHVLHGAGPEECRALISKAVDCLKPGGRFYVQEFVLEPKAHPWPGLFGLNMLVNTPAGKAYSFDEITAFFFEAGLSIVQDLGPTRPGAPASIIMATG